MAKTPGFSSFAITGKATGEETVIEIQPKPDTEHLEQKNGSTGSGTEVKPEQTGNAVMPWKENASMSGFEILYCIFGLLGAFLDKRR